MCEFSFMGLIWFFVVGIAAGFGFAIGNRILK